MKTARERVSCRIKIRCHSRGVQSQSRIMKGEFCRVQIVVPLPGWTKCLPSEFSSPCGGKEESARW
jgi:hypothetical protein